MVFGCKVIARRSRYKSSGSYSSHPSPGRIDALSPAVVQKARVLLLSVFDRVDTVE